MNLYLKQRNHGSYLRVLTKIVNSLIPFSVNHFVYRPRSGVNGSSNMSCFLPWVSGLFPQTLEVLLKAVVLLPLLRKMKFSAKVLEACLAKEASLETPEGYYLGQLFICLL